jgi:hypothetical protein
LTVRISKGNPPMQSVWPNPAYFEPLTACRSLTSAVAARFAKIRL